MPAGYFKLRVVKLESKKKKKDSLFQLLDVHLNRYQVIHYHLPLLVAIGGEGTEVGSDGIGKPEKLPG